MPRRKTNEEFVLELAKKNPYVVALDAYINIQTKIHFKCKACGWKWETVPDSLLAGHGCPKCAMKNVRSKTTKSNDEFLLDIQRLGIEVTPLEKYINAKTKIMFRCNICNNQWAAHPNQILTGHGCPKCGRRRIVNALSSSNEEFRRKVEKLNLSVTPLEEYTRSNIKILFKCNVCGNQWRATPNNILRGGGCPKCSLIFQSSFPEQAIYYYVKQVFPNAINKYRENFRNTELDVYIPEIKCGIEYDGAFWHKSSLKKEQLKYRLAKENGITLIRVREYPLPVAVGETCDVAYSLDLGRKNYAGLSECIKTIMCFLDRSYKGNVDVDRDIIQIKERYLANQRENSLAYKYPEIALQWYSEKNGAITPDMISSGTSDKYWWKCPECNYIWEAAVNSRVINGTRCPRCSGYLAKENEVFLEELKAINDTIIPIEDYVTANTPINFQCLVCNHIWQITPSHALNGRGCPNCREQKRHDVFISKLFKIRPNIELLSEYISNNKEATVRCKKCGYIWSVSRAYTLLQDKECPQCSGNIRKTNASFINELAEKAPNIIALDEYVNAHRKMHFQCKRCGNIWVAQPCYVLRGTGCPSCHASLKTNDQFITELSSKTPNVIAVDEYKGCNDSMRFRCLKCNYEWIDKPVLILRRENACPNCKKDKPHPNLKTTETFIAEMKAIDPMIEITGSYQGVHKPIEYVCKKCGHSQFKSPGELLRGRGHSCKYCK